MVPNKRNYNEFNIANIKLLTPEQFDVMLSNEIFSLVLVSRLKELKDYFMSIQKFEMLCAIRDWCDLHKVKLEDDAEDEEI